MTVQVLAEKGQNHCEIARVMGVTEGAVRYHLRRAAAGARDRRGERVFKVERLGKVIAAWFAAASEQARPVNVQELHQHLVTEYGYEGSYPSVVRFVRARYPRPKIRTYRRVETPPGAQSQTDWGEYPGVDIAGERSAIEVLREQGLSKKAVARDLRLDIKTVRRWWARPWRPQERPPRGRRLDRWAPFLRARAPEVSFNAAVLQRELAELGEVCSYRAVTHFIAAWRTEWRGGDLPTLRFETGPGEQAQVDWGTTWAFFGEEQTRIHIFTLVLGYSRRLFAKAYLSEGREALLEGHASAFAHFGGRTETILYDNPRTIVIAKDEAVGKVVAAGCPKTVSMPARTSRRRAASEGANAASSWPSAARNGRTALSRSPLRCSAASGSWSLR